MKKIKKTPRTRKPFIHSNKPNKLSKVLLFDLETTPHAGLYWGKNWETDIIEPTSYGRILSYSAKWLGQSRIITRGWIDFRKNGELRIVKELWVLLSRADVVVAHNGRSFDIKWCNTKFILYRLPPPAPYKLIDTKIEAKRYLLLPSYSLNNISDYFKLGKKVEHEGLSLWQKCIAGDKKAWGRMKKYNRQDVVLLEKVYLKLQAWGPGQNLIPNACSRCGSPNVQARGYHRKLSGVYKRYQCQTCGSWSMDRKSIKTIKPLQYI